MSASEELRFDSAALEMFAAQNQEITKAKSEKCGAVFGQDALQNKDLEHFLWFRENRNRSQSQ
ncbi:hypothetical protein [Brucella pituitosa]|uniref:Uncharacterized protein n=1 Tax=Brucella pituitosa TaxID=571256 RepID=A0ABS3JTR3_9HYPH|nr:hypothetical protein [Brucella pituitosa]MBO1038059.1 hypothetical protein [Brucella pituitosa]